MKVEKTFEKSEIEKIIGEPITNFSLASGSKKGDNVAGNLLAINVTTASGEKYDLVYKGFPTGNAEQLQYVVQFGIFRVETCMYEKVFPRIEVLLKERENVTKKELPIAKYISGHNDDQTDYLCMEDMRPKGFIMQDKFNSLTVAEVALVMRETARFHALTYYLMRYDGEKMFEDEALLRIKHSPFTSDNPMMEEMGSRMFFGHMQNAVELLKPRDKALAEHVENFVSKHNRHTFYKLQRFNNKRTDVKAFACIIHGDLWTNNILFKYANDGDRNAPTEIKFIDFQLSRRGNIFEDLSYFYWTSTTPEFRKNHLDSMLIEYYNSFVKTLNELDFPKPEGFTKGFLLDGFQEGILAAYTYMPFALSLQMGDLTFMSNGKQDDEGTNGVDDKTKPEKNESEKPTVPPEANGPPSGPPVIDFDKMMEEDKKMMMLRMQHSPRALQRLEDLTKEVVEMSLI